jgi:hypothetical protein
LKFKDEGFPPFRLFSGIRSQTKAITQPSKLFFKNIDLVLNLECTIDSTKFSRRTKFSIHVIVFSLTRPHLLPPPRLRASSVKVLKEQRGDACNVEKCKAFSSVVTSLAHHDVQAVDTAVKRHTDGVTVLGIPHGSDLFVQRELSTIVKSRRPGTMP